MTEELASVHQVFHVSILNKCLGDPASILPVESLRVGEYLFYEELPVEILDRHVKRLWKKEIATVKVLWRNHLVEDSIWEAKDDMRSHYPHLSTLEVRLSTRKVIVPYIFVFFFYWLTVHSD